ncbi:MAG: NAD(+) diphosphatase [Cellvibrionaceae bacterium]|nr:NAD(+) diphosphatase [Cellvibrionaceae bacterium]MCV6625049.1 NAD(+) diphosphatase [Cellvibrionaceae bacterium]
MNEFQTPKDLQAAEAELSADSGLVLVSDKGVFGLDGEHWQALTQAQWLGLELGQCEPPHLLGHYAGRSYFCQYIEPEHKLDGHWFGLRELLQNNPSWEFELVSRASQVCHWDRNHRFCGHCGSPTEYHSRVRARACPSCGLHSYPRISPCVIVLVRNGEHCLLARHNRSGRPFFTCLAGFVEAGESAEQCARREVREEVGVEIVGLQYWGSQAWPFPGQLMLAFMADYAGGEICPEPEEIAEAHWYHYRDLPLVPPSETISGQLIEAFIKSCE